MEQSGRYVGSNKLSIALISVGTGLILVAIGLMALVATDIIDDGTGGNSELETVAGFGNIPTAAPTTEPSPEFGPGSPAPIARIVIPVAEVDAPVVTKGVDQARVMQAPDTAYDTAWYDFSAKPGWGGNAVFSGHVDYINVGKAVFWNLKDLNEGDVVEIRMEDGATYRYAVNFKQQYDAATAPVDQIVGPTPKETVTLITCSGTFDTTTSQYDKRLVVRAERIA
jgi:LPXTG-site transpeptidase (sortase) family protein